MLAPGASSRDQRRADSLVLNDSVHLCAVVLGDAEADGRVGLQVVAVLRDRVLVDERELERRDAVSVRCGQSGYGWLAGARLTDRIARVALDDVGLSRAAVNGHHGWDQR